MNNMRQIALATLDPMMPLFCSQVPTTVKTTNNKLGDSWAVLGKVQFVHIRDEIYQNTYVILDKLSTVSHIAETSYARVTNTFNLHHIPPSGKSS